MPVRRLSGAVASRGAIMNLDSGLRTGRFRPMAVKPPSDHFLSVRQDFAPVYRNTWWLWLPVIATRHRPRFTLHKTGPVLQPLPGGASGGAIHIRYPEPVCR